MIPKNQAQNYLIERISKTESIQDLLNFPRYLEIETIHKCNAKCRMCPVHNEKESRGLLSQVLFEKIVEELKGHIDEIKRVNLYRDGEPLLDKELHLKIYMLKQIGVKEVAISTNVSLLNSEKAKQLLDSNLDIIIMSIDSLNKTNFTKIRKGLNFNNVIQNAFNFIQLRNQLKSKTKIWMRMIRQDLNWNEWDEYKNFWQNLLAESDRINYHPIHNWGGTININNLKSFQHKLPCVALWSHIVIFANGDVPLCSVDYLNNYPTGNITKQSIYEIWHSKIINHRRDLHLSGQKNQIKLCEKCNAWDEPSDINNISKEYFELCE